MKEGPVPDWMPVLRFARTAALTLFTLFAGAATPAHADNEEGYTSKIEGVGLWWLNEGESATRSFRFGEVSEFALHCNGKNKVYIYEMGSRGFTCNNLGWSEYEWSPGVGAKYTEVDPKDQKKLLRTIHLAKRSKYSNAGLSKYGVSINGSKVTSQAIFTVSQRPLTRGDWTQSVPTIEELAAAIEVARPNLKSRIPREKGYKYRTVLGYDNKAIAAMGTPDDKVGTYTLKIRSGPTEVILVPTLFISEHEGDLVSSVILREGEDYRFIGHVTGCLLRVGADIDGDGFPELIMENCYSTESQRINYMKIFPEIKALISYSHS